MTKPVTEGPILCEFPLTRCREWSELQTEAECWLPGAGVRGEAELSLMGTEFQCGRMNAPGDRLRASVNVRNASELYTYQWLRW